MHCPDAAELMSLRLDGLVSESQAEALKDHVASCATCASAWEAMRAVAVLFEGAVPVAPPPGLEARVMVRVRARMTRRRYARGALLSLLALVVMVALCGAPALTALSVTANQPAIVRAIVGLVVPVVSMLQSVLAGGRLLASALLSGRMCLLALGYVIVVGLLIGAWARLVTHPERTAWRRVVGSARVAR